FADDEHVFEGGFILRTEYGKIRTDAGAGQGHGDGPDGAGIGTDTVADAFVSVDDHGLSADHAEDVTFRADHRAGCAADAARGVNVRVLRLRAVGAQSAFFDSGASFRGFFLLLLQVVEKESCDDGNGD